MMEKWDSMVWILKMGNKWELYTFACIILQAKGNMLGLTNLEKLTRRSIVLLICRGKMSFSR